MGSWLVEDWRQKITTKWLKGILFIRCGCGCLHEHRMTFSSISYEPLSLLKGIIATYEITEKPFNNNQEKGGAGSTDFQVVGRGGEHRHLFHIFVYYLRLSIKRSLWIDVDSKQIHETSACGGGI